jgi:NADH-quinone oxidoreductase subunit A
VTLAAYFPVLLFILLASGFAIFSMIAASRLSPKRWTMTKMEAYECGITPDDATSQERERFPVKFYLVAMLFIVFDIETVFMYPWAVQFKVLHAYGLAEMGTFIAILLAAYAYVWKRGGLEWAE